MRYMNKRAREYNSSNDDEVEEEYMMKWIDYK
jgi:hypothetical protein